jgi:hypothetical protein
MEKIYGENGGENWAEWMMDGWHIPRHTFSKAQI